MQRNVILSEDQFNRLISEISTLKQKNQALHKKLDETLPQTIRNLHNNNIRELQTSTDQIKRLIKDSKQETHTFHNYTAQFVAESKSFMGHTAYQLAEFQKTQQQMAAQMETLLQILTVNSGH